jgi:hypothetical protein
MRKGVTPILLKEIQEQHRQIDRLEVQVAAQAQQVQTILKQLAK